MSNGTDFVSTIQSKVVDAPSMWRGSGMSAHIHQMTPAGTVNERFTNSNTNVPLWEGDSATIARAPPPPALETRQKYQSRFDMDTRHANRRMDHFFVAKNSNSNRRNSGSNNNGTAAAAAAGAGGGAAAASPASAATLTSPTVTRPALETLAESDFHHGRKASVGGTNNRDRVSLRPGVYVPPEEASIPRGGHGKRISEATAHPQHGTQDLSYHGKRRFAEHAKPSVSATTAVNDIGAQRPTRSMNTTEQLAHSARFAGSRRFNTNLAAGARATESAPSQEFDYDSRKRHPTLVPGLKAGGATLQYVFQAPPARNAQPGYRPTAPFATE